MCVLRVTPSCRCAKHVIGSYKKISTRVCLMARNEHMRLASPDCSTSIDEIVRSPQSVAQPVGWRSLPELGPRDVTIATKFLSRCPHFQTHGIRLPMGIAGAIVGRPTLPPDPELGGFPIARPWNRQSDQSSGSSGHSEWGKRRTPLH